MNPEFLTITRNPIIPRTAIYRRAALFDKPILYESCKLCTGLQDCSGNRFVEKSSEESNDYYRVIHVTENFTDWESLESDIWSISHSSCFLRLIIDREIPYRVLWAASFSEKNILQININMLKIRRNLRWIRKLAYLSGKCGLYNLMFLYPIIPELVKTYHVIGVMDSFRNASQYHIAIKFGRFYECKEVDGYINFNGFPVPVKYLSKEENGWKCNDEFSSKFLNKINIFAVPRNISISVCGENTHCIGSGG